MAEKMYLYHRPNHAVVSDTDRDPETGTVIMRGKSLVSAFFGLDLAVRSVCLGAGTLAEALRVLRKIEKANHAVPQLQDRYLVLKPSERKLIEHACNTFNWSRFCEEQGMNIWTGWMEFLEGFDPESDVYAKTWISYDPLNPPTEYADWKLAHSTDLAHYNARVAAAEAAARDKGKASVEDAPVAVDSAPPEIAPEPEPEIAPEPQPEIAN
jgi:hypothetical protein